jgi:hypothetical protein
MQTTSRVRKHPTLEQRGKVIEDYEQSHLTQKQFAAQRGIALSTLYAWRKKARGEPQGGSSQFVEAPNLFSVPAGPPCYRLRVPGGLIALDALPAEARQAFQALQAGQIRLLNFRLWGPKGEKFSPTQTLWLLEEASVTVQEIAQEAAAPPQIVPKSKLSDEFIIEALAQKYQQHVPVYRQCAALADNHGIELNRKTVTDAVLAAGELLRAVVRAQPSGLFLGIQPTGRRGGV